MNHCAGVDFKKTDDLKLVGRKALAISISDIAACGGVPQHAVASFGIPKNFRVRQIDLLSQGLFDLANDFKINIVGGDISLAPELVIDLSLLGQVEKRKLCLRRGAKVNDIILVTGDFGGSLLGKHLKFTPRLKEARYLVNHYKINSMIDVSDGLVQDLGHILEHSAVGGIIYEVLVPLNKDARNVKAAMSAGEDFELLFTASREEARKIIKCSKYCFRAIGEIMPQKFGLRITDAAGGLRKTKIGGYRHF